MNGPDDRAQALVSRFTREMTARGYHAAWLAALTERHAALFRLLAAADPAELLRGRPSPARWRALLPAAFAGTDPAGAAEILAVLAAVRAALYEPWVQSCPAPEPEAAAPAARAGRRLTLPTAAAFSAWREQNKSDPAVLRREAERRALFETEAPETAELAAARIRFLQKAYGVRLPGAALAAAQIPALHVDALAREGRSKAVYLLENLHVKDGSRKEYIFAVTYCHCLQPRRYPVFNRRVQNALCALREEAGFYPFLNGELRDYDRYLTVLSIFGEACGLAGTPLPLLAAFLEDLGARLERQP